MAACSRRAAAGASAGPENLAFACDVSQRADVEAGVARVLDAFGRIDAVVNNAGIAGSNSLEPDAGDDAWHQIIAVNLTGAYLVTKQVLPHLPDGSGRVINIGSVLALRGAAEQTAYSAAKHGLLGFTRALALHLARRRITANMICPGWVRTDMGLARMAEFGWSEERLQSSIPIGRWILPEEVAGMAVYLASEAAAGVTGQALTIDGGGLA